MIRLAAALVLPLLCTAIVAQQGELEKARALLLSEQFVRAAEFVPIGAPVAERALLEAAALPSPERARAMLALARAMPDDPVADRALVAGAGALLLAQARWSVVPELAEREDDPLDDWEERSSNAELEALLRGYLEALTARRGAERIDRQAQVEAGRLLRAARVVDVAERPVFLRSGTVLPVPSPLREELELAVHRHPIANDPWLVAHGERAPERVDHLLAGPRSQQLPALAPGSYVLELRSTERPWRVLRSVSVCDLDAVALRVPGGVLAMVDRRGAPAEGVRVRFVSDRASQEELELEETDERGLVVLDLEARAEGRLLLSKAGEVTWVRIDDLRWGGEVASQTQHHVAVDRPWYRPGERVQGRLRVQTYLRQEVDALIDEAGVLESVPNAGKPVRMTLWPDTPQQTDLRGTTDEHGTFAFEFAVPAAAPLGTPSLHLLVGEAGAYDVERLVRAPFLVASFRRAPILVDLTGPDTVERGAREPARFRLSARYASGAPAGGLTAWFRVAAGRDHGRRIDVTLDDRGQAELPLVVTDPEVHRVEVVGVVTAPDGALLRSWKRADVANPSRQAVAAPVPDVCALRVVAPDLLRPGATTRIDLVGPPHTNVLFAAVRGRPFQVERVRLDGVGKGAVALELPAGMGPSVDLLAVSATDETCRAVGVKPRGSLARVEVTTDRAEYLPGAEVELSLRTLDDEGRGGEATAVVAVVDERVYALRAERSLADTGALRPYVPRLYWQRSTSPQPTDPLLVLGAMLRDGALPAGEIGGRPLRWLHRMPGPSSGAAAGPTTGAAALELRSEFRATAFFAPALHTDACGRAVARFRLPDDLTRFRITVLAVDDRAQVAHRVSSIDVRKPLAVTPLVPRVLRVGDEIELPVVADAPGDEAAVDLALSSSTLRVDTAKASVAARSGAAMARFALGAREAGAAIVRVDGAADDHRHAVEVTVPVLADVVMRRYSRSRRLPPGSSTLEPPVAAGAGVELRLLGGRAGVLKAARRYLSTYPYGCVEQTLSRILPYFVVGDELDGDERTRLAKGLARLRSLRDRTVGGFAWWPRGRTDYGMTALVLHGLVLARRGGVDLRRQGLELDFGAPCFRASFAFLGEREGRLRTGDDHAAEDVGKAELAAAALRFRPGLDAGRAAVRRLVDAEQALPAGLLLRCGLALAAADDRERARAVLARLASGRGVREPEHSWSRFPGEGDAVVAAARLELLLELAIDGSPRVEAAGELLRRFGDGSFGTTYGTSTAFAALVREAGGIVGLGTPRTILVRAGDVERRVTLGGDHGDDACLMLPFGSVGIEVPEGADVLATWSVSVPEPGSTNPGWRRPVTVERALFFPDGKTPWRGTLRELAPVQVRITVRSETAARYVVVDCPLPAGCELAMADDRLEVHDDRVVGTLPWLRAGQDYDLTFTMVPSLVGRLRWPPATASAMYAPECQGGSPGEILEVMRAGRGTARSVPTVELAGKPRKTRSSSPRRLDLGDRVEAALERFCTEAEAVASVHPVVRHQPSWAIPHALREAADALDRAVHAAGAADPEWLYDVLDELRDPVGGADVPGAAPGPALQFAEARRRAARRAAGRIVADYCEEQMRGEDWAYDLPEAACDAMQALAETDPDRMLSLAGSLLTACANDDFPGPLKTALELLGEHQGEVPVPAILGLLRHEDSMVRWLAQDTLPEAEFESVPPAVLAFAFGDYWDWRDIERLARTAAGRHLVEAKTHDPEWCAQLGWDGQRNLMRRAWFALPRTFLREVDADEFLDVSRSIVSDVALLAELAVAGDSERQAALLWTLAVRGYVGPVVAVDPRLAMRFACILRAHAADDGSAAEVRRWLRADVDDEALTAPIRRCAWLCLGPSLTAPECREACAELGWDEQERLFAGMSVARLRGLLGVSRAVDEVCLGALPPELLPELERDLEALAQRLPDRREEVEEVLARVPLRAAQRLLLQVGAPRD